MILPDNDKMKEWLEHQLEAVKDENLSHYLQKRMNEESLKEETDEEKIEYHQKNVKQFNKVIEVNDKKIRLIEEELAKL